MATNFHAFFSYVLLGFVFILPLMFAFLKVFKIKNPKARMEFYILGLFMPIAGFLVFYNILAKRCQLGFGHDGFFSRLYETFCRLGIYANRYLGPLVIVATLLAGIKILLGYFHLKRLIRYSVLPQDDQINVVESIITNRCNGWNIPTPKVLFSNRCDFAAKVMGGFNPTIIISVNILDKLTDKELDMILTHELVHIKNRDLIIGKLLYLARDLMVFNPVSTFLLRGYLLERERLCDLEAAEVHGDKRLYAKTLLKVWETLVENKERLSPMSANFLTNSRQMEYRITSLLSDGKNTLSASYLTTSKIVFSILSIFVLWVIC